MRFYPIARRYLSIFICIIMIFSMGDFSFIHNVQQVVYAADDVNRSKQLVVMGNQLVLEENPDVIARLTGMNVPSLEWSNQGENVYASLIEACDGWNANVIRLPLSIARWYGCEQYQNGYAEYRTIVDTLIKAVQARGKYIILDCHWSNAGQGEIVRSAGVKNTSAVKNYNGQHKMPDHEVKDFWVEIAQLYKNNPAVLFNLYNEPHGVSWSVWRNGGSVTETVNGVSTTYQAAGHQQIVEAIRDTGAKNLIVAGGLDWGYDLTGVAGTANNDSTVYALLDQGTGGDKEKAGYGIIYDAHIYPWKGNSNAWDTKVGCVRKFAPVVIGEGGWEKGIVESQNINVTADPKRDFGYWVPELMDWMDNTTSLYGAQYGNQANFTGWCFHPSASPRIISNWNYQPTPYWGSYIKERLTSYAWAPLTTENYINLFNPDVFVNYTLDKNGTGAALTKSVISNGIKIAYKRPADATKSEVRMQVPATWIVKGVQRLQFKLQANAAAVNHALNIGFEETDSEIWTAEIVLQNQGDNLIDIPIHLLRKTNQVKGDGFFTGVAKNIYLSVQTAGQGELSIRDVVINRGGSNVPEGWTIPQLNPLVEYTNNFTPDVFEGLYKEDGSAEGEYFNWDVQKNADGMSGVLRYQKIAEGGFAEFSLPDTWDLTKTNTMHFMVQNNSMEHYLPNLGIILKTSDHKEFQVNLDFEADENLQGNGWHHVIYSLQDFINGANRLTADDLSKINRIKLVSNKSGAGVAAFQKFCFTNIIPPKAMPYILQDYDYLIDFDHTNFGSFSSYNGPNPGDYMRGQVTTDNSGYNSSQGFKISAKRAGTPTLWGGDYTCKYPTGTSFADAKTLSFMLRGDGTPTSISVTIVGTGISASIPITLMDDQWRRYDYDLRDIGVYTPENITGLRFYYNTNDEGYYILDDVLISSKELIIPTAVINDFEQDSFVWNTVQSGYENSYFQAADTNEGYDGKGKLLSFSRTSDASDSGGYADIAIPAGWNSIEGAKYLYFAVRGDNPSSGTDRSNHLRIILKDKASRLLNVLVDVEGDSWQYVIIPLLRGTESIDLTQWSGMEIHNAKTAHEGRVIIDRFTITNTKPFLNDAPSFYVQNAAKEIISQDYETNISKVKSGNNRILIKEGENTIWTTLIDTSISSAFDLDVVKDRKNKTKHVTSFIPSRISQLAENKIKFVRMYQDIPSILPQDGLVTVEMRLRRPVYGNNEITLLENSGETTASNNRMAKITLDNAGSLQYAEEYTGKSSRVTTKATDTVAEGAWVYIKAIMDMPNQAISLYYGSSLDSLKPWTDSKNKFNFSTNGSSGSFTMSGNRFTSISIEGTGTIGIDDVRIYTSPISSRPVANDVKIIGKPNIGQYLTGTYTYFDLENDAEYGSTCDWIRADDESFTKNAEIVKTHEISSDGSSVYQLTEADRGKYIMFSVTPRNESVNFNVGVPASAMVSSVGIFQIQKAAFYKDGIDITAIGFGSGGNINGQVTFSNTSEEPYEAIVFLARYSEQERKALEIIPSEKILVKGVSDSATDGIVTQELVTPTITIAPEQSDQILKLFVWNSEQGLSPYMLPVLSIKETPYLTTVAEDRFTAMDNTDLLNDGGIGWSTGWKSDNALTADIPSNRYIVSNNMMTTTESYKWGGPYGQNFNLYRGLSESIRLDQDMDYYITFDINAIANMGGNTFQNLNFGGVFTVGTKRNDTVGGMTLNSNFGTSVLPNKILQGGKDYTFLVYIGARASGNDVCKVKVFQKDIEPFTYYPTTWDYEAASAKSNIITYLGISFGNGSGSGHKPKYDDIVIAKAAPVYITKTLNGTASSGIQPIVGEVCSISIPQVNLAGNFQSIQSVSWYHYNNGTFTLLSSEPTFTVPDKKFVSVLCAKVIIKDHVTGIYSTYWPIAENVIE